MIKVGKPVTFVDQRGQEHAALVTAVWGDEYPETGQPGINVVYVSENVEEQDTYGRQIKRESSIVHQSGQKAPGFFWR